MNIILKKVCLGIAVIGLLIVGFQFNTLAQEHKRHHRGDGIGGVVTAIGSNTLTIKTHDGTEQVVTITDQTSLLRNRQASALTGFQVNDHVFVRGSRNATGQLVAEMVGGGDVPFHHGHGGKGPFGQVVAVDTAANTLTIKTRDGENQTISLSDKTTVMRQHQAATAGDLKVGDFVAVMGTTGANGQLNAERVFSGTGRPFHHGRGPGAVGEVKAIDANAGTITIINPDGKEQILLTSTNTVFNSHSQGGSLADLKVGDRVRFFGDYNQNGQFLVKFVSNHPPLKNQF